MKVRPRVLIIGTYDIDCLQSMSRYVDVLRRNYLPIANVHILKPFSTLSRFAFFPFLVRKYLGYVDKLVFFPFILAFLSRFYSVVHIADQGYSFYSFVCPSSRCVITCHDLLALRAALGDPRVGCKPSPIGLWLQLLIIAGLRYCQRIVFASESTKNDYCALLGNLSGQSLSVIYHPLNAPFLRVQKTFDVFAVDRAVVPPGPFLLMVGSSHPRKNRHLALKVLSNLGLTSSYYLVLAGAELDSTEKCFSSADPMGARLVSVVRPSHDLLNYLYSAAHALIFPSISEGFGWPLIEAQSCGCPVLASNTTSIPEVAGCGALYASPFDCVSFVRYVRYLENPVCRKRLVLMGYHNVRRFQSDAALNAYRKFVFTS